MSIWETTIDWDALPDARENTYAWDSLGELRRHNSIADANNMDESTERARKGTSWKYSVQAFCWFRPCSRRWTRWKLIFREDGSRMTGRSSSRTREDECALSRRKPWTTGC